LASFDERQIAADAAQTKRIDHLDTVVDRLGQIISKVESAVGERIGGVESGIKRDMGLLATSAEIVALGRSVSQLQKELGQLAAAIQELKPSGREDDGKVGGGTGDTGSTEGQGASNDGQSDHKESGESES